MKHQKESWKQVRKWEGKEKLAAQWSVLGINHPSSVFRQVKIRHPQKYGSPHSHRAPESDEEGNLLEGNSQPNVSSSDKAWRGSSKRDGGEHCEKDDNCISSDSLLNSFRFAFPFPISPLIHRLCHHHLLPWSIRKPGTFPRARNPFYIVCSLHFSVITQWYKSACVCVEGGNNCAINDCYFDYRMQLSLRLEANQRVVSGSPLLLSNGPWLKRKLLAIFKQQERKQHGWRWGKCQTLPPDGSQLIFTCSLGM